MPVWGNYQMRLVKSHPEGTDHWTRGNVKGCGGSQAIIFGAVGLRPVDIVLPPAFPV